MPLLKRDLFEPTIAQQEHTSCSRQERRSVGHDNAGDGKRGDEISDTLFGVGIDIGRALVENEDLWFAVERAGQKDALLLSTGEYRAHVADEREILHRHAQDVVMDAGGHGRLVHPAHVELRVEEDATAQKASNEDRKESFRGDRHRMGDLIHVVGQFLQDWPQFHHRRIRELDRLIEGGAEHALHFVAGGLHLVDRIGRGPGLVGHVIHDLVELLARRAGQGQDRDDSAHIAEERRVDAILSRDLRAQLLPGSGPRLRNVAFGWYDDQCALSPGDRSALPCGPQRDRIDHRRHMAMGIGNARHRRPRRIVRSGRRLRSCEPDLGADQ